VEYSKDMHRRTFSPLFCTVAIACFLTATSAGGAVPQRLIDNVEPAPAIEHSALPSLRPKAMPTVTRPAQLQKIKTFTQSGISFSPGHETKPIFDVPVTYNSRIRYWINYFQTTGRKWFRIWLERSYSYIPEAQRRLAAHGMPKDLAYIAMIESGFSSTAQSTAGAVGYWQFIAPTATRYGLKVDWWLDERQNFAKSTEAAIRYFKDLHKMFGSWYLVAAGYNTGENRVRRIIEKHGTRDFWKLAHLGALSQETINYVPKMIAAMLIAKAPGLYGFTDLDKSGAKNYEHAHVPGGVDLFVLAEKLNLDANALQNMNPELIRGIVPPYQESYPLRIPRGTHHSLKSYLHTFASADK
jgi:membrane-bound lytic murein transglycosylase D